MAFTTLISTDALAACLTDPTFVVIDCRFRLDDVAWGEREYAARHVPGATYAHLDRDLSGPKTGANGRHPLPDPDAFARAMGRLGVTRGAQVVAYDQDNGIFASRLWWLLRWLGHDAVAVLDGGFARWTAEGRPTVAGQEQRAAGDFSGTPRAGMVADVKDVIARIRSGGWRLVDARSPERYRGDVEPVDRVAGHIPTAVDHFFKRNLDEGGTFRTPENLAAQFRESLGGFSPDRVVCYCGSGVTACHNLLALEHAGLPGAQLYPGSWSEWSSDSSRPFERGDGTPG